jgi:peptide/nickel transport system substrate-binding protein
MIRMEEGYTRRRFLRDASFAGGGAVLLLGCTAAPSQTGQDKSQGLTGTNEQLKGLPRLEGGQVITDPSQFPATFRESPVFAKLTADGKLPPVATRLGQDPLVIKPVHEIGKYGGVIRRGFLGTGDRQNPARFCAGPDSLLYWDYTWENVVGNIARSYELSDGDKVLTLHLRRGMRWSDGAPFTADDIVFWRDDVSLNDELEAGSPALLADGKVIRVEKVDAFTVRYTSAVPNSLLPRLMAGLTDIAGMAGNSFFGGGGYAPKHYLSKFHPKYTSAAQADKLAKDAGFDGWSTYFLFLTSWTKNPDLPVVTPWVVTRPINKPPFELAANPYSIWVDSAGNQLPYIHTITMGNADNLEVISLRTVAGEFDFQDRHLGVTSLPVLVQNQQRSNYTVHRAPCRDLDFGVRLNLAYDKDKYLGDLIRTADFRRALSLGVDRVQVNQAFFLGTSVPSATVPGDDSIYFPGPEWRQKWATHDPAQANALLDKIGLTKKDSSGFRLRADGKGKIRLDYQAIKAFSDFPGIGEMIKKQWEQIGIDLNVQTIASDLLVQRTLSGELMLSGHQVGTDDPFLLPDTFLPTVTGNYTGMIGIPYAKWFGSGGKQGVEPPAELKLKEGMDLYRQGLQATNSERIRIGKELYKLHADQVWTIGVVGFGLSSYGLYIANNKLHNVPGRILNTNHQKTPSNALPMTFFYA